MPRAGIGPRSLAFKVSVIPLHHIDSLMLPLYPHLPVYAALSLRGHYRLLHSSPLNYKSFNAYNYIPYIYIHRVGSSTIQHKACTVSWSWHQCHRVWWKSEILCLEQESKPTFLACRASVLSFHHVGSLMSPLYPRLPVYHCIRGQCRLLHKLCVLFYINRTFLETRPLPFPFYKCAKPCSMCFFNHLHCACSESG